MTVQKRFTTVEIDLSVCKGCGMCIENCPPKVLSFSRISSKRASVTQMMEPVKFPSEVKTPVEGADLIVVAYGITSRVAEALADLKI